MKKKVYFSHWKLWMWRLVWPLTCLHHWVNHIFSPDHTNLFLYLTESWHNVHRDGLQPQSESVCESVSCSVVSDSLQPQELWLTRLLCLWDSPGKNTGVGSHFLLQGNLPHPSLLHCRQILYCLSHREAFQPQRAVQVIVYNIGPKRSVIKTVKTCPLSGRGRNGWSCSHFLHFPLQIHSPASSSQVQLLSQASAWFGWACCLFSLYYLGVAVSF